MSSDLLTIINLAQQPYFLCEVLPYWVSIIAGIIIALRLQR